MHNVLVAQSAEGTRVFRQEYKKESVPTPAFLASLLSPLFPVYGRSLFELSVRPSVRPSRPSTVVLFPARSSALQPLINRSEGESAERGRDRERGGSGRQNHEMPRAVVSQSLILDTNLMVACLAFEARLGGAPILNNNYKFPALFPPSLPSLSFSNRSREGERERASS